MADKFAPIVIIGAGCFGLSTALQLASSGYTSITVLDRSLPPVPDGSSVDISRILRADYSDPVYAALGAEALALWRSPASPFHIAFRPCPFLLAVQDSDEPFAPTRAFLESNKKNLKKLGLEWRDLRTAEEARRAFPEMRGRLAGPGFDAYVNDGAGWGDAAKAIGLARDECVRLGVSFVVGKAGTVTRFVYGKDGRVEAVETVTGLQVKAEQFILATGAWTASLVGLGNATTSTAQIVAFVRLKEGEEYERLKKLPIYINLSTGFFAFPTHPETGFLKIACHGFGYTNVQTVLDQDGERQVSMPKTRAIPQRSTMIPEEGLKRLREGMVELLGEEYRGREFEKTSLCWYTETVTGDFIVDRHPKHKNLLVATGGSGHGFKMLPVVGKYIVQALEGTLSEELKGRWRLDAERMKGAEFIGDGSRGGPPRREFLGEEKAKL